MLDAIIRKFAAGVMLAGLAVGAAHAESVIRMPGSLAN